MQILDTNLKFKGPLTKRTATTAIILHHPAMPQATVERIHEIHLNDKKENYLGIAYNFYIRKDGSVYKGRGWDTVGAHAGAMSGYNPRSVGVCFEGNYETESTMPREQFNAGVEFIIEALRRYGDISILGHRQVSATACPGKNFPLEEMKKEAKYRMNTDRDHAPSDWAKGYWEKACTTIGTDGKPILDGTNPQGVLTREQLAAVLVRSGVIK